MEIDILTSSLQLYGDFMYKKNVQLPYRLKELNFVKGDVVG